MSSREQRPYEMPTADLGSVVFLDNHLTDGTPFGPQSENPIEALKVRWAGLLDRLA